VIVVADLSGEPGSMGTMEFAEPVRKHLARSGFEAEVVHFRDLPGRMAKGVNGDHGGRKYDGKVEGMTGEGNVMPEAIFLCGTALADNAYREEPEIFSWLRDYSGTVLGICAGMHIICLLWGGKLTECERIGVFEETLVANDPVSGGEAVIKGYHLHGRAATIPDGFRVLRESDGVPSMIKLSGRNVYGVLFHPEVLNGDMIVRAAGIGR